MRIIWRAVRIGTHLAEDAAMTKDQASTVSQNPSSQAVQTGVRRPIGIDAIAFAVPRGYVDLTDLATARGVQPSKYIQGLGVSQMSVAHADEDPVTLATEAARRCLKASGRSPSEIGLCIVGTETAVDHSKPISSYLHGLLGLSSACRVFETKHACFGGTAGLMNALDWLASGSARGRCALIVCTDIARYSVGTAGEPTQGAGAVAMLISEDPRVLELEPGVSGSFSQNVHDFWRPLYRKDALVDGQFSVQCYLDALTGAYAEWQRLNQDDSPLVRTCYHVPYGKMARKAHQRRCQIDGLTDEAADKSFAEQVEPSLRIPSQVGNIYTGSLYLALLSLLHHQASELAGQRIGLFSYGSGCAAEFFAGRVLPTAATQLARAEVEETLANRQRLAIPQYEDLRRNDANVDQRPAEFPTAAEIGAALAQADRLPRFSGIDKDERRIYTVA